MTKTETETTAAFAACTTIALLALLTGCGGCGAQPDPAPRPTQEVEASEAHGADCAQGSVVSPGTLSLDLSQGDAAFPGECFGGAGATVRRIVLEERSRVRLRTGESDAAYLWIGRRCDDAVGLECDGFESTAGLIIDEVLDPGPLLFAVAADPRLARGAPARTILDLDVEPTAVIEARCAAAPTLESGHAVTGTTRGAQDRLSTPCHEFESGPEALHRLVLDAPTRVRVTVRMAGQAALWISDECPAGLPPPATACAFFEVAAAGEETQAELDALRAEVRERAWLVELAAGTHYLVLDTIAPDGADYSLAVVSADE